MASVLLASEAEDKEEIRTGASSRYRQTNLSVIKCEAEAISVQGVLLV